jgi:hypothetical protein
VESHKGPTLFGSSLAHKCKTRVEVPNTLAYYEMAIIMTVKKFYSVPLGASGSIRTLDHRIMSQVTGTTILSIMGLFVTPSTNYNQNK